MDVLETIKNIECNHLGIYYEIDLEKRVLDPYLLGHYNDQNRVITLNKKYVETEDASKVLFLLLHECYHAYSFQQVELLKITPDIYKTMPLFSDVYIYQNDLRYDVIMDNHTLRYYIQPFSKSQV
jgi:hypothetical protein